MTVENLNRFIQATACMLVLILPLEGSATAGVKAHRKIQKTPIKLGTSGGNVNEVITSEAGNPCRTGTLGGLVQDPAKGVQYILSSVSRIALENDGKRGDPIIQPGLADTKGGICNRSNPGGQTVANLSKFKKVKFGGVKTNKSHGALAEVRPGMVNAKGKIIGIGIPGDHVVAPFLGQQLRKSGRGTGVRTGTVVTLNVTANVGNFRKGTARFANQIIVDSDTDKQLAINGDIGSIFFENSASCPGWVGQTLGLSQDGRRTLVSKMSVVLNQLSKVRPKGNLSPVGCTAAPAATVITRSSQFERTMLDAELIQSTIENDVMLLPGVIGMGIGVAIDNPNEVVFKILVEEDTEATRANIPEWLGEVRAEVMATGGFSEL